MKFKELGFVSASLVVSLVGMGINGSSAQVASFFGEDIQEFGEPNTNQQATDAPDLGILTNSYAAEQSFLNALSDRSFGTVNFEQTEGFTELDKKNEPFNYDYDLIKADGDTVTMNIFDANKNSDKSLNTTLQKTNGKSNDKNTNLAGGRYGISDAGLTKEQRLSNQFLNTNAGSDSSLLLRFSDAVSAFGFYGTDFERGGLMGYELTRADGNTKYINLNLTDAQAYKDRGETIRGTAFYSGYIADSVDDYFTEVRFDIKDAASGTNDIVGFDRMTFAAATMKKFVKVPEPNTEILALGAVVSGIAFKRRKKK